MDQELSQNPITPETCFVPKTHVVFEAKDVELSKPLKVSDRADAEVSF